MRTSSAFHHESSEMTLPEVIQLVLVIIQIVAVSVAIYFTWLSRKYNKEAEEIRKSVKFKDLP